MANLNRPETSDQAPWHAATAEAALERLSADQTAGLTDAEAQTRRQRYGANAVRQEPPRTVWQMIAAQFSDFMILVLVAAAVISGAVGDVKDSIAIIVIVMLNAAVGVVQEYRAERALEALRGMTAATARVLRAGSQTIVPAVDIVPGEIVLVGEGDIVPADLRLLEAATLRADESMLTGESVPVDKDARRHLEAGIPVGDRINMVFKGAIVTHGRAVGLAVATGMDTELGRIADMLVATERVATPLQRRLARFGWWLSLSVLALCAVFFLAGLLRGEPPLMMFLTAVSLAVAAVPEALPAVVTVALALGAREMMRRNALVRALPAVETLGSVTTICADKTGTLTQNRMHVETAVADGGGDLNLDADPASDRRVEALLTGMALCSDVEVDADRPVIGDPTEVALSVRAAAAGMTRAALEERLPRIAEIAFDADRKRMTTIHRSDAGYLACTKGAPEAVLPLCVGRLTASGERTAFDPSAVLAEAERLAGLGLRIIAFAERRGQEPPGREPGCGAGAAREIERDMTFIALVGLLDPTRPEAHGAVAQCIEAGITPLMITGDHPATAARIARQLGIFADGDQLVTGPQLHDMSDDELARRIGAIRVFARADPAQKIRIVRALQSEGEIVAMTGDGVNDAPALRQADIGVAMGRGGTDVAREAASLVLLDDNFSTIVGAVRAGRRIYDNVRKFIKYTMTSNSGELATILLAPFLGLPIPLLPIHILWINLVTDGLPGLALAVEPEEDGLMQRAPRAPDESIFAHGMWQHIVWCGLAMGLVCLATQAWAIASGRHESWQTMVFTVLTFSQMGHVLAIRSELTPLASSRFFANPWLLGAVAITVLLQLAVIYVPALNPIFRTTPLSAGDLAICLILSTVIAVLVECEKWYRRRRAHVHAVHLGVT